MNLEDLDRAVELKTQLAGWEKALTRVDRSIFKSAELLITDAAHLHMGQTSQSKIGVDRDVLVRIPANPEYCSLNLAMSVQLTAYEIFMAREQPQSHTQLEMALAPSGDVEHFYAHLHEVLNEIDFEDRTGHLMERLRRLFNRAQLDRNELNILRGILSAVQGRRGQSAQRSRK